MKQTTVCFLIRKTPEMEVLLGLKKIGFGSGKFTGIGGKVESGESIEEAAIREVEEEIGVKIAREYLEYRGAVKFIFPSNIEWSQEVSIFLAASWSGDLQGSNEMDPYWFKPSDIPYHQMWQDAAYWLPKVLAGTRIQSTITFLNDNETVGEVCFG